MVAHRGSTEATIAELPWPRGRDPRMVRPHSQTHSKGSISLTTRPHLEYTTSLNITDHTRKHHRDLRVLHRTRAGDHKDALPRRSFREKLALAAIGLALVLPCTRDRDRDVPLRGLLCVYCVCCVTELIIGDDNLARALCHIGSVPHVPYHRPLRGCEY